MEFDCQSNLQYFAALQEKRKTYQSKRSDWDGYSVIASAERMTTGWTCTLKLLFFKSTVKVMSKGETQFIQSLATGFFHHWTRKEHSSTINRYVA